MVRANWLRLAQAGTIFLFLRKKLVLKVNVIIIEHALHFSCLLLRLPQVPLSPRRTSCKLERSNGKATRFGEMNLNEGRNLCPVSELQFFFVFESGWSSIFPWNLVSFLLSSHSKVWIQRRPYRRPVYICIPFSGGTVLIPYCKIFTMFLLCKKKSTFYSPKFFYWFYLSSNDIFFFFHVQIEFKFKFCVWIEDMMPYVKKIH